jgi:iron(III) transport system substrate-binding protein
MNQLPKNHTGLFFNLNFRHLNLFRISDFGFRVFLLGMMFLFSGCGKPDQVVVVYTSVDQPIAMPLLQEFERLTGIKVEARTDGESEKTVGLTERVRAEKNNPQCDVWWCNEPFNTINLAHEGVLEAYESQQFKQINPKFVDPDKKWAGNGMRVRMIVNYTEGRQLETVLHARQLQDLTKTELKGKIGMGRPALGTIAGHVAALYAVWGEKKADQYFRDLHNNGLKLVGGNSVAAEMVGKGTLLAAIVDNDDADAAQHESGQVEGVIPDETIFIPCTVGIVAGAKHPEAAKKLADFLLSKKVEDQLIKVQYCKFSVRADNKIKTLDMDYNKVAKIMPQATQRATAILEGRE